jgi:hypothetical protein
MLRGIDYTGKLLGNIDFIEASWDRKWSEAGEFIVQMTLDEYNRLDALGMKYIENVGRPEQGVIQKTEYEKETEGAFVTVSGFFIEKLLDYGTYRKTHVINASTASAVKTAIESYISNANAAVSADGKTYTPLKSVTVNSESVFPDSADNSIEQGTLMGTAIYETISGTGYGILASISGYPAADESGALGIDILFKTGRQLTSGDTGVFFGKAYNNVDDMSYTVDESAEKCLYEVIQEVDEENYSAFSTTYFPVKYTEVLDGTTKYYIGCTYFDSGNHPSKLGDCYPKKILTTTLSSDECDLKDTTTANQQKIRSLMQKKAQLDMLDNYKVESIEVNIIQVKYEYMKDYDLGDTCAVLVDDLKQLYYARIEKINETHKDNKVDIQLVLGTPSKQKWRKI